MTEAASLEFRLLGPLDAVRNGHALALGGPKHRTLLAALLLHAGEPVAVDVLAEALWPDRPPAKFDSTLQVYVSQLRRELGREAIVRRGPGYVLAIDPDQVDAIRFERLAEEGRAALAAGEPEWARPLLEQALALWRGPALADFRYDAFASHHAERLEELRLAVTEALVDADLALGRAAELVPELQALVAANPLREQLRVQLMLALYRSGRQSEALAAYHEARRVLQEELGLDPGPQLRELEAAILRQDESLATPARAERAGPSLPAPPNRLIGRERDLDELAADIGDGARLVTITGPGGMGKTRLALALAERLAPRFGDGTVFCELAPVREPLLALAAIAERLSPGSATLDSPLDLLERVVADRRMLLVLDNLEQVTAVGPELAALLRACPRLVLLTTSRTPLHLAGEREYALEPLPLDEAGRLFRERGGMHGETVDVGVEEICERLDRLPLAIELAAARVKLLGPAELLARLEERLPLLTGGPRDAPERHRALAATIAWSHELLAEEDRAAFERLAVFAGPFTLDAADAVCETGIDTLASLADSSLLARLPGEPLRLGMLATVREFAFGRLVESQEGERVRGRHALYVADRVEAADERLVGPEQQDALIEIAGLLDDLRAALDWALEQADEALALRLVAAAAWFWFLRGPVAEGRQRIEQALALPSASAADAALLALVHMRYTALAMAAGDMAAAEPACLAALELRRSLGDSEGVAAALINLGLIAFDRGDFPTARGRTTEALELARQLGNDYRVATALCNLGGILTDEGDPAGAIPLLEESMGLADPSGDGYGSSAARENLAAALVGAGDLDRAGTLLAEAVELRAAIGDLAGISGALIVLADLACAGGDPDVCVRHLAAADAIRAAVGGRSEAGETRHLRNAAARARDALGEEEFEREWAAWQVPELDAAVEYARAAARSAAAAP